jgi:cell division septation protein DedD
VVDPRRPEPGHEPVEGSSLSKLRDFDKVRERMVLRIEVRHIVQLAVLVLCLAATAFVGGWAAGKNGWQPSWLSTFSWPMPEAESVAVANTVAPAPPAAALAVAAPATPAVAAEAAAPGEQVVAPTAESVAATGAVADADLAPAATAVASVEVAPTAPPEAPKVEAPQIEAAKVEAPKAEVAKADGAPGDGEEGRAADKPATTKAKGAIDSPNKRAKKGAKATDAESDKGAEKTAEKVAEVQPPRAGRPAAGKYMVQIKAFRNESEAQAFADELRGKGYTVSLSTVEVPDKGQFFRVRLGPFGTLDAARTAQKRLESAEGHATILLSVP